MGRKRGSSGGTLQAFVKWAREHPTATTIGIVFTLLSSVIAVAQGVDWAADKLWPDRADIIAIERSQSAKRDKWDFLATIENPTNKPLTITSVNFRKVPSPPNAFVYAIEVLEPVKVYEVPLTCSPGRVTQKLSPALKVPPNDAGAVLFRVKAEEFPCELHVSFETSQGQLKEQKAFGP